MKACSSVAARIAALRSCSLFELASAVSRASKFWILVLGFPAVLASQSASAWDSLGHMIVAAVAYDKLEPNVRTRANELIRLNPHYQEMLALAKKAKDVDQDKAVFMIAATWPDMIKGKNKAYTYDGEHSTRPEASRNIGYADKLQHRYWHYYDAPFSPDHTKLVQPTTPNAKTQIALFRATISSSTATDDLKSYDLVWLLHDVGDVHQPLHATSRFDKDHPEGDNGGNLVTICSPCTKLHSYWDDILGTGTSPTAAVKIAHSLKTPSANLANIADESKWVEESFEAAKSKVYGAPIGVGKGPFDVDDKYHKTSGAEAKRRMALAGARLANLLNEHLR